MKPNAFDIFHPAVPAWYFLAVIVFCMAAFQPVFVAISLAGALVSCLLLRGVGPTLRSLTWQLPLLVIIAVVSPLFYSQGSTELFRIGSYAVYFESFAYSLCMGAMLVAMTMWIAAAATVITSDKAMALTGRVIPTVGLMISMVTRLVPQFVDRGQGIAGAASLNRPLEPAGAPEAVGGEGADAGAGGGETHTPRQSEHHGERKARKRAGFAARARQTSVLMGWAMEDSLDTAESMRARGWGAAPRRTTYRRSSFRIRDALVLVVLGALVVLCAVCAVAAVSQYSFYPRMSQLILWWGYIPYAVLVAVPLLLEIVEAILWKMR